MEDKKIAALVEKWAELEDKYDRKNIELKDIEAEIDLISADVYKFMDENEMQNMRMPQGLVHFKARVWPKIVGDEAALISFFDQNGVPENAPRTVNKTRLKEYMETALEENKPLPPTELVQFQTQKDIVFKRTKTNKGDSN